MYRRRESKESTENIDLRSTENAKTDCAKNHYLQMKRGVRYVGVHMGTILYGVCRETADVSIGPACHGAENNQGLCAGGAQDAPAGQHGHSRRYGPVYRFWPVQQEHEG